MRLFLPGVMFFVFNVSVCVSSNPLAFTTDLTLQCFSIPQNSSSLCSASTIGVDNTSNDLLLYQLDEYNQLHLLDVQREDGSIQWLWGLSEKGKYTVLVTSEEGHSSYAFYLTEEVINLSGNEFPQPIAFISDYYLSQLAYVSDSGEVVFARLGGVGNADPTMCSSVLYKRIARPETDACYVDESLKRWTVPR